MNHYLAIFIAAMLVYNAGFTQYVTAPLYPRAVGYLSFVNPVVSIDKNGANYNFTDGYSIGFPAGVNVLKSDKIGFSFEVTPFIKFTPTGSKVNNVLFHPGVAFRYPAGFTVITRLAFETGGRYGATVVFNKIIYRTKLNNYFIAIPVPARFGNNRPASIGISLQAGVFF